MADDERIRLCVATRVFYPAYGGGALRFARYMPGLVERSIIPEVLTATHRSARARMAVPTDSSDAAKQSVAHPVEIVNGARVHRVQIRDHTGAFARGIAFGRALTRYCQMASQRPDVVQLLSLPGPLIPALYRLRRMGLPVVSQITVSPTPADRPRAWFSRELQMLAARAVDRLIVSSQTMQRELRALGVLTPMVVIPNGVDTERFRPARPADERRTELRRNLGIPQDAIVLLTVGGVNPRKGIELLLEAWSRVSANHERAHLMIAGPRTDLIDPRLAEFRRTIQHLLRRPGSDRIHFTGLVEDIEACYRAADIFVFASRREGMPNAFLEAMASGLPVVTTPFIGRADELGRVDEHYLLVDAEPRDFATQVESLIEDPRARTRFGSAARNWVSEHMTLASSLDRYAATYREIVDLKGCRDRVRLERLSNRQTSAGARGE